MAGSAPSRESPPAPTWRRYALVGLVLFVLVAATIVVFWPRIQFQLWMGELHSDTPTVSSAAQDKLVADDSPDMNDWLYAALTDPGQSFQVRERVGHVLVERNRLNLLEKALRESDPAARTAALSVLQAQSGRHGPEWFRRTYLEGGEYAVLETLEAWLQRDGDLSRKAAVDMVSTLDLEELVPLVRPIVRVATKGSLVAGEQQAVIAAASVLLKFGDCGAVVDLVEPATSAPDDRVRLRMVQALYESVAGVQAKCPDAVPAETVKAAVLKALEDGQSYTRHGALLILTKEPAWAEAAAEKVREVLDGKTGDTVWVRRAALTALSVREGDAFARELPRYFHSDADAIRSSALEASRVLALRDDAPVRFESCWIGLLRDDTSEQETTFQTAAAALREAAGRWVGFSDDVSESSRAGREAIQAMRNEMFERGESRGVSRLAWTDAWFRWLAADLGLSEQAVEDAAKTRAAFWEAADADDRAGAKQALDAFAAPVPDLFLYEQGWLDASD